MRCRIFVPALAISLAMVAVPGLTLAEDDEEERRSPAEMMREKVEEVRENAPRPPAPPEPPFGSPPEKEVRAEIDWVAVQAKVEAERERGGAGLASLQADLAANLPNLRRPELAAVMIPVLIPAGDDVARDSLEIFGQTEAYTARGELLDGTALRVAGTRKKLVLDEPPAVLENLKRLRDEKPRLPDLEARYIITRSESSTDLSFSRFGCGYVLSLICDDPDGDERCADDAYITALANTLQLLMDRDEIRTGDAATDAEDPATADADDAGATAAVDSDDAAAAVTAQASELADSYAGAAAQVAVEIEAEAEVQADIIVETRVLTDESGNAFSYLPVGELLPQSGPGFVDQTIYRDDIVFPTEDRAFLNSQVYRYGGYQGSLNGMEGGQCEIANFSYPWQDTFCEKRSREQQLCPGGGHEGLDIRPATCTKDAHWAVAVEDARVVDVRRHWVTLQTADGTIYNYLHLNMGELLVEVGDEVRQGARLGRISNDFYKSDGSSVMTTIHLHFEMYENYVAAEEDDPLFTKVNPYATLVSAYYRKMGG